MVWVSIRPVLSSSWRIPASSGERWWVTPHHLCYCNFHVVYQPQYSTAAAPSHCHIAVVNQSVAEILRRIVRNKKRYICIESSEQLRELDDWLLEFPPKDTAIPTHQSIPWRRSEWIETTNKMLQTNLPSNICTAWYHPMPLLGAPQPTKTTSAWPGLADKIRVLVAIVLLLRLKARPACWKLEDPVERRAAVMVIARVVRLVDAADVLDVCMIDSRWIFFCFWVYEHVNVERCGLDTVVVVTTTVIIFSK